MSESTGGPITYRVSYSERVRQRLRSLIDRATAAGPQQQVLTALHEMDRRLHIYPQFGQPLCDLRVKPLQLWIASIPPIVVRYVLDEDRKEVMIGVPILTLPNSGF